MTSKEIPDGFKMDIEKTPKVAVLVRLRAISLRKSMRELTVFCFEQSGEDKSPNGVMNMNSDGMICLHPHKPYQFVWMAISERWPLGKSPNPTFSEDKKKLFGPLQSMN